jgi:hypothetical protein
MKTKSFLRFFTIAMAFLAVGFGLLSSLNTNAQVNEQFIDVAGSARNAPAGSGGMGCYIITVLNCGSVGGVDLGQQSFCSFTGAYGAPYNCEGFGCYGTITQRHCVEGH